MNQIHKVAYLAIMLMLYFAAIVIAADGPLSVAKAVKKVGQKVTIELEVQSAGKNAEFQELYSTRDWQSEECFFLRFSNVACERFAAANIPDVAAYFLKEKVRVTGTVKIINVGKFRKPVINVEKVEQIVLVDAGRKFTSTEKYQQRSLAGFTVLIHPEILKENETANRVIEFITGQLEALNEALPKDKVERLKKVRIWLELETRKNGGCAYHPSAIWLKENGLNPEKAGCIEISHVLNYLQWSRDNNCSGLLHEMTHALHSLHLGDKNDRIIATYKRAMDRKLFDSVPFVQGGSREAYAKTNEKEYFAEISEAYFGRNDFFPFSRDQLKAHDPDGFDLVKDLWFEPLSIR